MNTTRDTLGVQVLEDLPKGLSVIIPVYNSEAILPSLLERIHPVLQTLNCDSEIILVNDCSSDNSWDAICELAKSNSSIRGINLMKNFGQHNALLCGIRLAVYNTSLTIDDDLQHPPESIPELLAKLDEGVDVVYGSPKDERHGFLRDLASQTTKLILQKGMGADAATHISAFRAFRTSLRSSFAHHRGSFVSIDVMLTWATRRFATVPTEHASRHSGQSNYTLGKLIMHTFNMITGFSVIPLQIASIVGFVLTIFGVFVLVYVVVRYFIEGTTAPGFPFLAAIISIFSGAQLCALGIIGEYLSRMHFRLMDCQPYTVRSTINCNDVSDDFRTC